MSLFVAAILGIAVGISLGAVGGGGSILAVPALVYALGQSVPAATTGSLVIVGTTALSGVVGHARTHHVRWATGGAFGVTGVASSLVGTRLNSTVDPNLLLTTFAVVMIFAAIGMLRRRHGEQPTPRQYTTSIGSSLALSEPKSSAIIPGGRSLVERTHALALAPTQPRAEIVNTPEHPSVHKYTKIALTGLTVGFMTGFFGVGGGFVIVPALALVLGYGMLECVGTSLLVIAVNSVTALVARAGQETFHWSILIPFTMAAVVGAILGKRIADNAPADVLTRAFAVLMLAVALYVGAYNLAALT